MPAPKRANTAKATETATARRVRAGQETQATKLREQGWVVIPPEHADQVSDEVRHRWSTT